MVPEAQAGALAEGSPSLRSLSSMTFRHAGTEIISAVQLVRSEAGSVLDQVIHAVDHSRGAEVTLEDPALQELFTSQVIKVEESLSRVRANALGFLVAAEQFTVRTAEGVPPQMKLALQDLPVRPHGEDVANLEEAIEDAQLTSSKGLVRARARVQQETIGPIDERLREHNVVREDIRERRRWVGLADRARKDASEMRGYDPGDPSALRRLSHRTTTPTEDCEARLHKALDVVRDLDAKILASLFDLQASSSLAVFLPFAALVQIQAEFYTSEQANSASMAGAFKAFKAFAAPESEPRPVEHKEDEAA